MGVLKTHPTDARRIAHWSATSRLIEAGQQSAPQSIESVAERQRLNWILLGQQCWTLGESEMDWVIENLGTVAALVVAVAVLIGSIFGAGRWVERINTSHTKLRNDIDRNLAAFKEFAREIRDDVREVRNDIKSILLHLDPRSVASGSPLHLTDLGQSISDELDVAEWAERTAPELMEKAKGMTAYKVQEMCFEYVQEWLPPSNLDEKIDAAAYTRGMKRKGVLDVFAIELRNELLAQLDISS